MFRCGVPVEGLAAPVVAHRRSRVGVTGRFLDITMRYASIQGGGDEGVTQRVRPDPLADLGSAGDAPHDPTGRVTVQSLAVGVDEDRPAEMFADRQVDRPGQGRLRTERRRRWLANR